MKKIFITFALTFLAGFIYQIDSQIKLNTSYDHGQIFDVTYHPNIQNTLYAHTITNHLVKSTDNGATWSTFYSYPLDKNLIQIKYLKFTKDNRYLTFITQAEGTEENTIVILDPETKQIVKQITSPNSLRSSNLIMSYDITGNDYQNVLMHTTYIEDYWLSTDIFYSTNSGDNWNLIYQNYDHNGIHVNNAVIDPRNPSKIYIGRGFSPNYGFYGGLLISENAGNSWTEKIPGNTYNSIEFDPINPNKIIVGTFYPEGDHQENVYISNDNGDNWQIAPITWNEGSVNSIQKIVINPRNNNQIIVIEENEVVVSTDGGTSWATYLQTTNDVETDYYYGVNGTINPYNNDEIIISCNYYPFRSLDGGITYNKLKSPFALNSSKASLYKDKFLYYGVKGGSVHYDFTNNTQTEADLLPIDFIFTTSNMGIVVDPVVENRLYQVASNWMGSNFVIKPNNDPDSHYVLAYSNYGLNIYQISTSVQNPNLVWASLGEATIKLDLSDMDNITYEEITMPEYGPAYGLIIDEANNNRVTIGINNNLYITENAGNTWTKITSGLENLQIGNEIIKDIKVNPSNSNEYILSSTLGIFISYDKGLTWTHKYNENAIYKAEYSPKTNGLIVATSLYMNDKDLGKSESRIVYSTNNGEAWTSISPNQLENLMTESSAILFKDNKTAEVFFTTSDLGLVSYTLDFETLNISDFANKKDNIIVYPNPATDQIFVNKEDVRNITITDMNGKTRITSTNQNIIVSPLNPGIYFVNITTKDGKTMTKKLIKK